MMKSDTVVFAVDKAIGHGIGMTHSCHGRFYKQFGAWAKSKE